MTLGSASGTAESTGHLPLVRRRGHGAVACALESKLLKLEASFEVNRIRCNRDRGICLLHLHISLQIPRAVGFAPDELPDKPFLEHYAVTSQRMEDAQSLSPVRRRIDAARRRSLLHGARHPRSHAITYAAHEGEEGAPV